jgi:hypothetical protein
VPSSRYRAHEAAFELAKRPGTPLTPASRSLSADPSLDYEGKIYLKALVTLRGCIGSDRLPLETAPESRRTASRPLKRQLPFRSNMETGWPLGTEPLRAEGPAEERAEN